MTYQDVNNEVLALQSGLQSVADAFSNDADRVNDIVFNMLTAEKDIIAVNVAYVSSDLTLIINDEYLNCEYHLLRAYYYASGGILGFLAAAWEVISTIIEVIREFLEIFHIIEIIHLADLLGGLIPQFQEWKNSLFSVISEA